MDLGHEIGQKIRDAIKSKLQELGSYVDDELPEYIMVMLANKRNKSQMNEDLLLFLGENTAKFTDWLFILIEKLTDVAGMAAETPSIEPEPSKTESVVKENPVIKSARIEFTPSQTNKPAQSLSAIPKSSSKSVAPADSRPSAKKINNSTNNEKHKLSSSVVKPESKTSIRKRHHGSDDEDTSSKPLLPSVVRIQEKKQRPSLQPSNQACGSLLRRAVAEAHSSVSRLHAPPSSLTYDPTTPSQLLRSQSLEEKRQQKELLLQQHRELQKQLQRKELLALHDTEVESEKAEETELLMSPQEGDTQQDVPDDADHTPVESVVPTEPVIELCVSEAEALELCSAEQVADKDTRIVAFADSPTGNDDEEEKRRRRKKRAVKSRDRPRSPKFIVTLDGADSKLEDKYKKRRSEKSRKHKKEEFDDYVEVDTSNIPVSKPESTDITPQPAAPPVEKVMINLDASLSDEEETVQDPSPVKARPTERCKFWPDCKNGDSCPFFHPTIPCRTFPNCTYGESCMFVHPMCKFDERCTNTACPFLHKMKNRQPLAPILAPPKPPAPVVPSGRSNTELPTLDQLTLCKFFPACTRAKCPFHHPPPPTKICRYGNMCTRTDCVFTHPPQKAALKWKAPTQHISERSFALTEQSVTKMPVVS